MKKGERHDGWNTEGERTRLFGNKVGEGVTVLYNCLIIITALYMIETTEIVGFIEALFGGQVS